MGACVAGRMPRPRDSRATGAVLEIWMGTAVVEEEICSGGVPERLIGTVLKTVICLTVDREFESHPLRHVL